MVGPLTSWLVSFVEWAGNSTEYRFGTTPNFRENRRFEATGLGLAFVPYLLVRWLVTSFAVFILPPFRFNPPPVLIVRQ